ncbi:MAG: histidine kinase [Ilumatobacter coccineus]|uniref:Histidine kinase n=1 Tax=Ilumatobacter coccineus TaxID=467094 RepID=A0A2G6KFE6_9ACTN|nr:MAG: histidine kinase [Ilumatobacter coccineus]
MTDKKTLLRQIMTSLAHGDTDTADAQIATFMDTVSEINADDVTEVAQSLDTAGVFTDASHHTLIEQRVFGIIDSKIPVLDLSTFPEGHPVHTFLAENTVIKELCQRAQELVADPNSFDALYSDWAMLASQFAQLDIHYLRKENQLFPALEKRGFSHPSTIMWTVHDVIRGMAKTYAHAVEAKDKDAAYPALDELQRGAFEMTVKEEKILFPKSSQLLSQNDWIEIRGGEDEIGWCYIDKPILWNPTWTHPSEAGSETPEMSGAPAAPQVFNPDEATRTSVGGINLEVGNITPEQINLIFKFMPFDVTFVDEFDEVRYYNKGDERVFPRSPGIIGRQVRYCHPPKSVHVVEEIIDAFKKGERDEASFWINFRDAFVYIQYFALRNHAGHYKGVIEITQDASTVRGLEGEQRLLDWE